MADEVALTPAEVVARQVEAYNARDLDLLMACYDFECVQEPLNRDGGPTVKGFAEMHDRYRLIFQSAPQLRAVVHNSITVDNTVTQRVTVTGLREGFATDAVIIYLVNAAKIARVLYAMLERPSAVSRL